MKKIKQAVLVFFFLHICSNNSFLKKHVAQSGFFVSFTYYRNEMQIHKLNNVLLMAHQKKSR